MRTITIICRVVSAVVLIGLAVWVLTSGVFLRQGTFFSLGAFDNRPLEVASSQSVSAQGVRAMNIDWTSGRVYVRPWDGSEIQITEFSSRELAEGERLLLSAQGDTVIVAYREGRGPAVQMVPKHLEVLIPRELSGNFESFAVNTVSARVYVSGIDAASLSAGTVSGRVNLTGVTSERLRVGTTSGRMELNSVSAEEIDLRSISGRVELTRAQAGRLIVDTTSGRQELHGAFERASLQSVSGRVELTSTILPADLAVGTTSGRVAVTVPYEGAISLNHSSASGRFNSDIPVIMHAPDAQFRISTTSGRVEIFALR